MNKRILSLVLALVMVLGTFTLVTAAEGDKVPEYTSRNAKIQWLQDNEIVLGRKVNEKSENNDLALDKTITRAEVTKLLVYTQNNEKLAAVLQGVMKPFPDVDTDHWANGYISVATTTKTPANRRIVIGDEKGYFNPNKNVSYAELATMLVRIVKTDLTDKMEENAIWATTWMRWADELGILTGVTYKNSDDAITRAEAFEMIFNAMYKLGKYDKSGAKFGDVMGVVSKFRAGEIQLNQDPKMTYKLTANTLATDGTRWSELALNADYDKLGSLVRLIADKDGNVTHIIELGNDGMAKDASRWFGVAKKTVSGQAKFEVSRKYTDITVYNNVEKVFAEIDKDTRFFVADRYSNAFKEFKTLDEMFTAYNMFNKTVYNKVYMGYNTVDSKYNVAKVIVFGDIDKYQGQADLTRVTRWITSDYRFEGENTKGDRTFYDIQKTPLFPARDIVDVMDVVDVRLNDYYGTLRAKDAIKIDYSEANVYKVYEIGTREVVLQDKDGYRQTLNVTRDVKIFLEREYKKGAHVQIHQDKNNYIDIISVVNKDLKGILKDGNYTGSVSGYPIVIEKAKDSVEYVSMFKVVDKYGRNSQYYYVTNVEDVILLDEIVRINKDLKDVKDGIKVSFDVRNERGGVLVAYNFSDMKKALDEYKDNQNKEAAKKLIEEKNEALAKAERDITKDLDSKKYDVNFRVPELTVKADPKLTWGEAYNDVVGKAIQAVADLGDFKSFEVLAPNKLAEEEAESNVNKQIHELVLRAYGFDKLDTVDVLKKEISELINRGPFKVKVTFEKDGVKASEIYTINFEELR